MVLKWQKIGDELKSSDGRFVIWTLDGRNFSLDDKKYSRGYPAISKTAKGCKQRAEMILAEEAPRKSLPATGAKAMTQFVEGSKVRTGNVRSVAAQYRNAEGVVTYTNREWIFVTFPDGSQHKFYERELTPVASTKALSRFKIGDEVMVREGAVAPRRFRGVIAKIVDADDVGYHVVFPPDFSILRYREAELKPASRRSTKAMKSDAYEAGRKANAEGVDYLNSPYSYRERHLPDAAEWQRGWMDAEREKRSTKSLELRAKYKGRSSGVTIRENMNPTERAKIEDELRKLYTRLYDGDISVQMRIAYLEDRYPEMRTMVGRNW